MYLLSTDIIRCASNGGQNKLISDFHAPPTYTQLLNRLTRGAALFRSHRGSLRAAIALLFGPPGMVGGRVISNRARRVTRPQNQHVFEYVYFFKMLHIDEYRRDPPLFALI